jgi:hypothetical protein
MSTAPKYLMTSTATTTTPAATHRGRIVVSTIFRPTTLGSKYRKKATHLFTMTLHTHDIIRVLIADQQLKFVLAVWAVIFVQRHVENTSMKYGEDILIQEYCSACSTHRQVREHGIMQQNQAFKPPLNVMKFSAKL